MEEYWWAVYVGLAVGLTAAYQFLPEHRRTVIFFAAALGAVGTIGQIQAAAAQNRKEVEHRKIEVSFKYMEQWNASPLKDVLQDASDALNSISGKAPQQGQTILEANEKQRKGLMAVFNDFEDLGLAVRTGYADNASLCQYFSEPGLRYFSAAKPWLDYYRQQTGRRGAYEHYEWLYQNWEKGCPTGSLQK